MKYQAGLLAITSFLVGASTLYADTNKGSIVMIGKGTASSPPEFVSFSVKVTSICYNTSQEAQAENAKLASPVVGDDNPLFAARYPPPSKMLNGLR